MQKRAEAALATLSGALDRTLEHLEARLGPEAQLDCAS
jgi:hypothetical protein